MSRKYRRYTPTYYSYKPISVYMAEKHIEEAQKLEAELGSSVQHVKEYLYSLSGNDLNAILNEYEKLILSEEKEQKVGGARSAKAYAKKTLEKWKSGETEMSGLVAQRFFKILPHFMPLEVKYGLIDKLCAHLEDLANHTKLKTFYVGRDFDINQLITNVKEYYEKTINSYEITEDLKSRFNWLSQNDVTVKKLLVDYFKNKRRDLEIAELKNMLVMLSNKLQDANGKYISGLEHSVTINNNTVKIIFHKKAQGIMETEPKPKGFWETLFW